MTVEEGTVSVEAGAEVTVGSNTVVATSDYTVSVSENETPIISGVDDLSAVSVEGTAQVDFTPSTETETQYSLGDLTFTTKSNEEDSTLSFTISGTSTSETSAVDAVGGLNENQVMSVANSGTTESNITINGEDYAAEAETTQSVVGNANEEGYSLLDTGNYYAVIENGEMTVYALTLNESGSYEIEKIDGEPVVLDSAEFGTYDGSGNITLKAGNTYLIPTTDNIVIVENRDDVEVSVINGKDTNVTYVEGLTGLTAHIYDETTIKLGSFVDDVFTANTEVPTEGAISVEARFTVEVVEDGLTIANTVRRGDAAAVEFGETVTLVDANLSVENATTETFTLGTAETDYAINGITFTSATAEDTVAFNEDGSIALTSTGEGMTASDADKTYILTAGGTYTLGETAYTVETTDSTSFGDNLLKVDFASADTPIENPAISFTGGLVAEVSTAGSATVNDVPFTASTITDDAGEESVSALTITAEADGSATLRDGSVEVVGAILTATVVNDDTETTGKTLDASNSDGVTAVVAEGVFTSITALTTDDEVVVFDGDTYTRQGNLITVTNDNGSTVYNVSTAEDGDPNLITLADEFTAIPYYPLTDENSNTVVLDSDVTEFYCGVPAAFNASTYYAHAVLNDNGEYEFELNTGDEAETPASFAVDATAITEPAIVINIAAEITTAGTATVNGDTFTSTGEGLTINVAAGAEEPATTLFAGTVTVSDSLATTSDGDVTVAVAEGSESTPEVTVVVIDGTVTSITGTDDGETVSYDGSEYQRVDSQIIVTTNGETTAIYDEIDDGNDLKALGDNFYSYVNIGEDGTDGLITRSDYR